MLTLRDGSEILYVGPLDMTTMAWKSVDGEKWNTIGPPDFNTRMRFATPDAVIDPEVVIGYTVCSMAVQDDLWCPKAKTEFGGTNQKKFYMLQGHSTLVLQSILLVRGGRTTIARMKPVFEKWGSKKVLPNQSPVNSKKKIRDRSGL